ncbi:MAG: DEAD/DEAH box helicase family protein [Candidatus Thiodiazotropha sp. (ex Ctena orbiculata)]|nr:DEAD/DEAH box helicase family protein [Candidatus Thiodiazotropha taylori]
MSNFTFLTEWPEIETNAQRAERLVHADPRGACFYARYTLERAVHWMYEFDNWLQKPKYDNKLNTLIHQNEFRQSLGHAIFPKIKAVQKAGNNAVHSERKISPAVATQTVKELHHILYWFYRTYTAHKPASDQRFVLESIPQTVEIDAQLVISSTKRLKEQEKTLAEKDKQHAEAIEQQLRENAELREKLAAAEALVAQQKAANAEVKDSHDYNEAETRSFIIDQYLKEMGWDLDAPNVKEFEVSGMPNPSGVGFVDYVLWGADGKPLAVVEAKRTTVEPTQGRQQAMLYADCLEQMFGQRPLIYYSNGYEITFWDDCSYPLRPVQGFLSRDEMQRLIDRRRLSKKLDKVDINTEIAGYKRPYQIEAIRSVCEQYQEHKQRKSLLVMATGTGKTRTTIALVDLLMRAGWIRNVLFLADRNALVNQAKKEFGKLLPKVSPAILSGGTDKLEGRLYLATYPTMMNLLSAPADSRLFGVGHFDLVIVDEAHRSVYKKYGYIFDYFDSLLLGLTATPKADIDRNTYEIFDQQEGVPTFAYELHEAVADGFLVPPKDVDVGLGFIREGIKYSDLSPEEQEEWESKEELEGRDEVLPSEVNQFLFNTDTVDKALAVLLDRGVKVAGGDRLGKTIIFAANNKHAEFVVDRINANYPKYKGKFARVITYKEKYADTLIDEFKGEKPPQDPNIPLSLAVSVDMLDTGIDVPQVVNLMFFKVIKSKVKFLQMLGRGTRLSLNLFGPGEDKEYFKVFDCCKNFEYFEMNPDGATDSGAKPLSQVIFEKRLQLSDRLKQNEESGDYGLALRGYLLDTLRNRVVGMRLDNFIVRPRREVVEKYQQAAVWQNLTTEHLGELERQVADLPTEAEPLEPDEKEEELALRFDHMLLTMQLGLVEKTGISDHLQDKLITIVSKLESKSSINAVAEQLEWIQYIQSASFWQDLTLEELEQTRRHLRLLMGYIEKESQGVVYTNFADEVTGVKENDGVYIPGGNDLEIYRRKVEAYVREHEDDLTIQRIKRNLPITQQDLDELDNKLFEASGIDDKKCYLETIHPDKSLGVFIRELVGMDRNAAKEAFAEYLDDSRFNSQQIRFVNTIIDFLTSNGVMSPAQLAQPPFSDIHFEGVFGLFEDEDVSNLTGSIKKIGEAVLVAERS